MNAKTRKLFESQHLGKIKFKSMGKAQKAAYSYMKTFGRKMNGYKCDFCDGYHIGKR